MRFKKFSPLGLISLCILLSRVFEGLTQVSYDFAIPLPPTGKIVSAISERYLGTYSCDVPADLSYEFTGEGVYVISWNFNSISRTTLRESSSYRVSNGWLHGVIANNSIPCELEGEYYHFAIKRRELLVGEKSLNVLTKISDRCYILNFANAGDPGHFIPSIFEFKGNELYVKHFTYEDDTRLFDAIEGRQERKKGNLQEITLHPTKEEWKRLNIEALSGEKKVYTKRK